MVSTNPDCPSSGLSADHDGCHIELRRIAQHGVVRVEKGLVQVLRLLALGRTADPVEEGGHMSPVAGKILAGQGGLRVGDLTVRLRRTEAGQPPRFFPKQALQYALIYCTPV